MTESFPIEKWLEKESKSKKSKRSKSNSKGRISSRKRSKLSSKKKSTEKPPYKLKRDIIPLTGKTRKATISILTKNHLDELNQKYESCKRSKKQSEEKNKQLNEMIQDKNKEIQRLESEKEEGFQEIQEKNSLLSDATDEIEKYKKSIEDFMNLEISQVKENEKIKQNLNKVIQGKDKEIQLLKNENSLFSEAKGEIKKYKKERDELRSLVSKLNLQIEHSYREYRSNLQKVHEKSEKIFNNLTKIKCETKDCRLALHNIKKINTKIIKYVKDWETAGKYKE